MDLLLGWRCDAREVDEELFEEMKMGSRGAKSDGDAGAEVWSPLTEESCLRSADALREGPIRDPRREMARIDAMLVDERDLGGGRYASSPGVAVGPASQNHIKQT